MFSQSSTTTNKGLFAKHCEMFGDAVKIINQLGSDGGHTLFICPSHMATLITDLGITVLVRTKAVQRR
ncbi:unnamed protein product [Lathyrus oleraceus]